MNRHHGRFLHYLLVIGLPIIVLGGVGYGTYRYYHLSQLLKTERANTANLRTTVANLSNNLSLTAYERDQLTNLLAQTEDRNHNLETTSAELAGTVDELTKLTTLDPELLKKYSKVYFLNEHYTPSSLTDIDPGYISGKGRTLQIHEEVWPHLQGMIDAAGAENLHLLVASAYRSFGTQAALKANYKVTYGTSAANRFSADQGYSEHQLGTTVDLTTASTGDLSATFDKTKEFAWLVAHAHEYGFVLSYPKNNKYYIYEPWHWRYVGINLATMLHDEKTSLYDVDQREIDTYLPTIFD